MKNFEAYENKIKEFKGNIAMNQNNELVSCNDFCCRNCKFNAGDNFCTQNIFNWLYEEYKKPQPKIKISLATKVILENLNDKYEWVAKDKDNSVYVFSDKPIKTKFFWSINSTGSMYCKGISNILKDNLFSFLSWEDEEPTNIKELLENCEVID